MTVTANGLLQHHFWGTYSASIRLRFHSKELATQALGFLPGFKQSPSGLQLGFHGSGKPLVQAEALLVALGANRQAMTSVAHSIDFGDPFTITIDLTPEPTEVQQELF